MKYFVVANLNDIVYCCRMTNKNLLVTKSNILIEASYKLTTNEQRIVLSCIAQLDGRKPLPSGNEFTISAGEFAKTFNLKINTAYEALKDASDRLYERDIKTYDRNGKANRRVRWVYKVNYEPGDGKTSLGFSPTVAPYLTKLHEQFTSYQLKRVSELRSAHSIRIFEMLQQFLNKKTNVGFLKISLDDFKDRLEIGEQYPRFYDIRRRIINPAIKELKAKSNMLITYDTKKVGRSVIGLVFTFEDDVQMALNLEK